MDNQHYLSPTDIDKQEHLSLYLLQKLSVKNHDNIVQDARPNTSLLELMNWSSKNFKWALKESESIEKYLHNRIVIDGQFLEYCKEKDISVECLHKEAILSWKTESNYESFVMQGVFLIKSNDVEFLHGALSYKGSQYEDEIGFFVIASVKSSENYLKLRNDFDDWAKLRERDNLHITVIGGEYISYTKDHSWDELFLPPEMKKEIRGMIEGFLTSQDFYLKNKIPWKKGIILHGVPGNGKTSLIRTIISEYNFKPVTISASSNDEMIQEAFRYAEEQSPSLLYFEDLDSLLERNIDTSSFLNLMDGISSKNGIFVVATANEIRKLKSNITDRPSRFDRKFEIPLPNQEMANVFLKKWFGTIVSVKKCQELAKYAVKYQFSYAYLKELYISSMFEALSNNRKVPTMKDIDSALSRLVKEKNILHTKPISMDKYTP